MTDRSPAGVERIGPRTWRIDAKLAGHAEMVAVFARQLRDDRWLVVEAAAGSTVDVVADGLARLGVRPGNVAAIALTHVHLDHASGAPDLAARFGAPVHVHPLGARHLVDPSRLWASAQRLYGDAMEPLWGRMPAMPAQQVVAFDVDAPWTIGGETLEVIDAPGHARHHVVLVDEDGDAFVGDVCGVVLPGVPLLRPALAPPEVDLDAAEATCERIRGLDPSRLLLTHFGEVTDVGRHLTAVGERNREWEAHVQTGVRAGEDEAALVRRMIGVERAELDRAGVEGIDRDRYAASSDATMTVMGLSRWLRQREGER